MKFRVNLVDAFVADGPIMESHVAQRLMTSVELKSIDGVLQYRARLADVPFGFDTTLTPGRFYTDPGLGFNYYCDRISGDLVHLTLVESYQVGNLVQAEFTAKVDKAKGYVEIADKPTINRLEKMLARLRRRGQGS